MQYSAIIYLMNSKDKKTKLLVTTALLTALVLICTLLMKVPVGPDCYVHLGDAVILLSVILLPRGYACFAGTVGATLADLTGGFAFWAPWTFAVKLVMILVFGLFLDISRKTKEEKTISHVPAIEFIGLVVSGIVAVIGYFLSEYMLFGNLIEAGACVIFNLIQVVIASIVAELLAKRIHLRF